MQKNYFSISQKKYQTLKSNVHLLKVKNKKAYDKINYKRNSLKEQAIHYLYSKNEYRSFDRFARMCMESSCSELVLHTSLLVLNVVSRKIKKRCQANLSKDMSN